MLCFLLGLPRRVGCRMAALALSTVVRRPGPLPLSAIIWVSLAPGWLLCNKLFAAVPDAAVSERRKPIFCVLGARKPFPEAFLADLTSQLSKVGPLPIPMPITTKRGWVKIIRVSFPEAWDEFHFLWCTWLCGRRYVPKMLCLIKEEEE